jgi:molybdenum cofactor biosynthesis enzyme MoaA
MIEKDAVFYHSLVNNKQAYDAGGYVVEVTDRCNLSCPHCYQEPDNKKQDKTIETILAQINSFPKDNYSITLAGAEPTMRKDLGSLVAEIKKTGRPVNILTNAVKLSDADYVAELRENGCEFITVGLNHPDYQGEKIHAKQLEAIKNCLDFGLKIKNINYTVENNTQIPFILNEIQDFGNTAEEYRIRGGADIGRAPNEPTQFLSTLVYEIHRQVAKNKWQWTKIAADDNIYHYTVEINGLTHRIIQWADAKTVDLDELQCGPWGSFIPNAPLTNLMHQVILRDVAINKHLPLLDSIPEKYRR